mmetsp:Transcript_25265/g.63678  ORF Transcript_25265/g.63678 Transcript_25265/m.63678 type:complete len:220 (-) Transcript_25265:657-1316(-)
MLSPLSASAARPSSSMLAVRPQPAAMPCAVEKSASRPSAVAATRTRSPSLTRLASSRPPPPSSSRRSSRSSSPASAPRPLSCSSQETRPSSARNWRPLPAPRPPLARPSRVSGSAKKSGCREASSGSGAPGSGSSSAAPPSISRAARCRCTSVASSVILSMASSQVRCVEREAWCWWSNTLRVTCHTSSISGRSSGSVCSMRCVRLRSTVECRSCGSGV